MLYNIESKISPMERHILDLKDSKQEKTNHGHEQVPPAKSGVKG